MNRHAQRAPVDLTDCDREPIHVPGSIQPHGMMVVLDAVSRSVTHVAGDVEGRLGFAEWSGRQAGDLLPASVADRIAAAAPDESPRVLDRVTGLSGELLDLSAFRSGAALVLEFEPADPAEGRAAAAFATIAAAGAAFERAAGLKALCERAAAEFRRLTGFDRVMIYRFLDDDAGIVLAEDRDPALATFLNHHFPASDIPKQARALYIRNRIRVIPDVGYEPAPLRAAAGADPVLDMSDSALRSVSPIHVQYLRNMGVAASASISIVKDGLLWGLIACHHGAPRFMHYETRLVCCALAGGLAREIRAKEEAETYRERLKLRGLEDEAVGQLSRAASIGQAIEKALPELQRVLDGDGFAVVLGREVHHAGRCPSTAEVRKLVAWAAPEAALHPVATDRLGEAFPPASAYAEVASGLLAVTVSAEEPFVLLWFRAEQVAVVTWAGDPHKAVALGPGETLSPRASFAAWSETVRGRSRPWSVPAIESAARLRAILLEARGQRRLRELNERLTGTLADQELLLGRQELLVKEVNHRVQNSLMLVTSFLRLQARAAEDETLTRHLEDAQRRIGAVALVHRRLYRADQVETVDLSRYLEELCGEIVGSLGPDWAEHVTLDLAPISIATDRAVPLGLILTELVINANKYAYGGGAGPIEITLQQQRRDFRLIVADRGRGRAEGGKGFGTRMMSAMVAQISGEIAYGDNRPGLRAVLTAPVQAEPQR